MISDLSLDSKKLIEEFESFILSVSGWRKIFSKNGTEDSLDTAIDSHNQFLALLSVKIVGEFWLSHAKRPVILVGSDTRPTSPALLELAIYQLYEMGCHVIVAEQICIPELCAACQQWPYVDGFFYISASHNPPGYNGFKFGLGDGKILPGHLCSSLIEKFYQEVSHYIMMLEKAQQIDFWEKWVYRGPQIPMPMIKSQTHQAYLHFLQQVAGGFSSISENEMVIYEIKKEITHRPLGILIDYNGSSRIMSCDRQYLDIFGVQTAVVGDIPGVFTHEIVPEGAGLKVCQTMLVKQHDRNKAYVLGYVPDCDGDRGNLVIYDKQKNEGLPLEAQRGFSLCVLSELAYLKRIGTPMEKVAIVVNDATSLRVNYICRIFGVQLFVVETGEANVIQKATELRESGYTVRFYGEGSNGGNITFPSTGRDPLNTLTSIIKLLYLRGEHGLMEIWCNLNGLVCPKEFDLSYILTTFPMYETTNVFEKESLLLGVRNPGRVKQNYSKIFKKLWPQWQPKLYKTLAVVDYQFISYEGQNILEDQVSPGTGGLRIMLYQEMRNPVALFWMRASKTEPVMRLLVDVEHHSAAIYQWLYQYHYGILSYAAELGNEEPDLSLLDHLIS
ncbi:MAG: hypothetical protein ACRCVN_03325 [Spirochaetia bacterium]